MILLTGGTGKTGSRLAQRLIEAGRDVRLASRQGSGIEGAEGIRFDWLDDSTHQAALQGVRAVYLVAPAGSSDSHAVMAPFIERALSLGVRRFVLLSASSIEEGGPAMGATHQMLCQIAPEWAVLRPTWFAQNFSEGAHAATIRDESRIYSATGEGRVPFVHADDIAHVAMRALTDEAPHNTDHIITGPQVLAYSEAAHIIGDALGRTVEHVRISEAQLAKRWAALGLPGEYAAMLAAMDSAIAHGAEDRTSDAVLRVTGQAPQDFGSFVRESLAAWQ
jgi:ergot alkaloid biosynthesis protein